MAAKRRKKRKKGTATNFAKASLGQEWALCRARLPPSSHIPETMADKMEGKLRMVANKGSYGGAAGVPLQGRFIFRKLSVNTLI
jgi:hypothetical protein